MYASVSNALAGQRASKKRAEDDVKLLANRLALLKLEEKKVSENCLNLTAHFATSTLPRRDHFMALSHKMSVKISFNQIKIAETGVSLWH
jgi:hypothetical protein